MNKPHYNARTGIWDDDVSSGSYVFEDGGAWYFKAFARGSIERHGPYGHENAARDAYREFADETLQESATTDAIAEAWEEYQRKNAEVEELFRKYRALSADALVQYPGLRYQLIDAYPEDVRNAAAVYAAASRSPSAGYRLVAVLLGDRVCRLPNGKFLVPFSCGDEYHLEELEEVTDL